MNAKDIFFFVLNTAFIQLIKNAQARVFGTMKKLIDEKNGNFFLLFNLSFLNNNGIRFWQGIETESMNFIKEKMINFD